MNGLLQVAKILIDAAPEVLKLLRAGRSPGSIELGEVLSNDALAKLRGAREQADDFIQNG